MKSLISVAFVLFLGACAAGASQNDAGVKDTGSATDSVVVTDANNGGKVSASIGQDVAIKLQSHADGGYMWGLTNDGGLGQPKHSRDVSKCAPHVMGCSGFDVYTFKTAGLAAGSYAVQLDETRFGTEPTATYKVTVELR